MADGITIERLDIQVKASADSAVTSLEKLSQKLSAFRNVLSECSAGNGIRDIAISLAGLSKSAGVVNGVTKAIKAMTEQMSASIEPMNNFSGALSETVQVAIQSAEELRNAGLSFESLTGKPEQTAASYEQLDEVLEQFNYHTKLMSDYLYDMTMIMLDASESADSLGKTEERVSSASASAAKNTNDVSKETKKLTSAATGAAKGLNKLVNSLKRIAMYRMLRTIIKNVSSAIKEGLTNLKEYSETVGTQFSPAVDNLRQHVLLLKNSFATALRPVIEALIPVIVRLCDWFSKLADFVAQVFSVLFGKTDENGRYTKTVLSDLEQGTEEAKKLKKELRSLMGFDEINRLDDNSDSGSGSAQQSGGLMFEQAEVSEKAKEWAERIQKVYKIIKNIVNAIVQFVKDNPWILKLLAVAIGVAEAFKLWNKYLKPVFTVLSNIIAKIGLAPVLIAAILVAFALWGDKIKEWIDRAKQKVDEFFNKIKEKHPKLAGFIDVIQGAFDLLMDTVGLVASAVYKFVHGDFEGGINDILTISDRIKEYFDSLLGESGLINGIVKFLGNVLSDVTELVANIIRLIRDFVKGDWAACGNDLLNIGKNILKLLVHVVGGAINIILGLVSDLLNLIAKGLALLWNNVIAPLINFLLTKLKNVGIWIHNAFADLRIGFFEFLRVLLVAFDGAVQIAVGIINGLIDTWNTLTGSDVKPMEVNIDTTLFDKKIAELEATKIEPLTETVDFVGKWTNPGQLKLQVDTSGLEWAIDNLGRKANRLGETLKSVNSNLRNGPNLGEVDFTHYASGGYPSIGSIFVAGEAGAEWVGDIGGRTGVMNTEQMAAAMYQAMNAALANNQQGGGDIYLDGEVIYRNTVRRNNNHVRSTGRSALLT